LKYHVPITRGVAELSLDEDLHNTVEIKEWDKLMPPRACLCQNTIQLLEERGVPKEYFISLAKKEIEELRSLHEDHDLFLMKYRARQYTRDSHFLFEDDVLLQTLHASVPLNEPVIICKVNDFLNNELERYREKVS
jgi:hypothetical protein